MTELGRVHHPLGDAAFGAESERVARRLHDGFIQSLFSVGMGLRAARGVADDPEAVSGYVEAAADQIDRIARQLRNYSLVLRAGLISGWEVERDLRLLAQQFEAGGDVSMAVEVDSLAASALAAHSKVEDVVQAVREAVAITLSHWGSRKVALTLFLLNGAAMLEVRGDGAGRVAEDLVGRGHDFSYLRAWARALRGVLEVESRPAEGTRVRVRIPVAFQEGVGQMPTSSDLGTRVVIVDDHEIVREGVRALIEVAGDIVVCGEARTAAEAVRVAQWTRPDVVVTDVNLPDGSGIDAARQIRARHPTTRVLVLTSLGDQEAVFSSIKAGASGFVLKDIKGQHLVEAIRSVAAGRNLLDPAVTGSVFERLREAGGPATDEKLSRLSPQEERILTLVARGKSNREIAQALHLAEKTVKNYVSAILSKLEVGRRVEAAAYFTRRF